MLVGVFRFEFADDGGGDGTRIALALVRLGRAPLRELNIRADHSGLHSGLVNRILKTIRERFRDADIPLAGLHLGRDRAPVNDLISGHDIFSSTDETD